MSPSLPHPRTVPPCGEVSCQVSLTPSAVGEITVTASFMAKELEDVDGFLSTQVLPPGGAGGRAAAEAPATTPESDGKPEEEIEMGDGKGLRGSDLFLTETKQNHD